jgi:hypothetical protein
MYERSRVDNTVKTTDNPTILKMLAFQTLFNAENDIGRTTGQ